MLRIPGNNQSSLVRRVVEGVVNRHGNDDTTGGLFFQKACHDLRHPQQRGEGDIENPLPDLQPGLPFREDIGRGFFVEPDAVERFSLPPEAPLIVRLEDQT